MNINDIVKFKDSLYPDEKGAHYRIIELNGDRAVLEFVCDLPIPPLSVAKIDELESIHPSTKTAL